MNQFFRRTVAILALALLGVAGVQTVAARQGDQILTSADGALSVHAPAGWVSQSLTTDPTFSSLLIVAENQTVLNGAIQFFDNSDAPLPGTYGIFGILNPQAAATMSSDPQKALLGVLNALTNNPDFPLSVNNVFQATIGDGYEGTIYDAQNNALDSRGYLGGFVSDDGQVVFFELVTSPISTWAQADPVLQIIGQSIRVPGETATNPAQPTAVSGFEPTAGAPEPMTLRTGTNKWVSLEIPSSWSFIDFAGAQTLIAYGDTSDAAESRLETIVGPAPNTPPVAITGNGGVAVLYKMSDYVYSPEV